MTEAVRSAVTLQHRLTKDEAREHGLVPPGQSWDEASQRAIPFGQALATAQLDRPLDLEQNLAHYARQRAAVTRFVADQLEEAEYDKDGVPLEGKLHDYYRVPGRTKKALTKLGAEHLGSLFRYFKGQTTATARTETAEYVSALVNVTILDHYGRTVGSAEAGCSTAEGGFQSWKARQKYGAVSRREGKQWVETKAPDYRAGLNDRRQVHQQSSPGLRPIPPAPAASI